VKIQEVSMTDPVRQQVIELIQGGHAHVSFADAIKNFPAKHSAWELLEHLRIAQQDILEFSRNPKHVSPKWPDGYWPKTGKPPSDAAWRKSVAAVKKDQTAMQRRIGNSKVDLYAPFPHGTGQNLLREALLIADHNAYHIGQLVLLRRLLGAWPK
jgi:hypothetical protein